MSPKHPALQAGRRPRAPRGSRWSASWALAPLLLASACGGCERAEQAPPAPAAAAVGATPAPVSSLPPSTPDGTPLEVARPGDDGVVHLAANDRMRFDAARIEVPAGEPVKIELTNEGELPVEAMGHNLAVLLPGSNVMAFAAKAASAKDTGYIPPRAPLHAVAHTKLLGPGQSDTIEVELPGPGTYPYLCTFPGHVGLMRGELVAH